jgi:hypothetical protein
MEKNNTGYSFIALILPILMKNIPTYLPTRFAYKQQQQNHHGQLTEINSRPHDHAQRTTITDSRG